MASKNHLADQAMLRAISRQDLDGLKRALQDGANANKTIKQNQLQGGNSNPMVVAARHGWHDAFPVLAKSGARPRAAAGKSAFKELAWRGDAPGVQAMAKACHGLTDLDFVDGIFGVLETDLQKNGVEFEFDIYTLPSKGDQADRGRKEIRDTFLALLEHAPRSLQVGHRIDCARSLLVRGSAHFQWLFDTLMPMDWAHELVAALPRTRRLVRPAQATHDNHLQLLTLSAATLERVQADELGRRLDFISQVFSIDLEPVLSERHNLSDVIPGDDVSVFEAAVARQRARQMQQATPEVESGYQPRPRRI